MSNSRNLTRRSGLITSASSSDQLLLNEGIAQPSVGLLSPISNRLLDAAVSLYGDDVEDMRFLHVVLAQCGLPYREPKSPEPFYEKRNGRISIVLTPGVLLDPLTRRPTMQGIPFGAKPRLLMIHLCTMATKTNSPEIDIAASMSAFMRDLGLSVSGGKQGSIARFKDQLNRLAATRMQLLFQDEQRASMVNPSPAISRYDVWFPKDPNQRVLWPTTLTLSQEFFTSLQEANAVPLDGRAVVALQHSAMALDVYTWLAHRLRRIPVNKPASISWSALKDQFGPEYSTERKFRQDFKRALQQVLQVYPAAKVEVNASDAVTLRFSESPISDRRSVSRPRQKFARIS